MDPLNDMTLGAGRTRRCVWPAPPARLSALPDEVHIWCADLDAPDAELPDMNGSLSADERQRVAAYRFERDRRRFAARRAVLRGVLGRYLGVEPADLAFSYGANGKPALAPPFAGQHLQFNLSHSHGLALYAVASDRILGVDLEQIRPFPDAELIAGRYFSSGENATLGDIDTAQRLEAFFNCWTRKEAFVKATGEGLARPLDSFDVSLVPGEPARLLRFDDGDAVIAWSMQSLTPSPGFRAAVVTRGSQCVLRCWRWELSTG